MSLQKEANLTKAIRRRAKSTLKNLTPDEQQQYFNVARLVLKLKYPQPVTIGFLEFSHWNRLHNYSRFCIAVEEQKQMKNA